MTDPLKPEELPAFMEWSAKEIADLSKRLHDTRMLLHIINVSSWFHAHAPDNIRERVERLLLPTTPPVSPPPLDARVRAKGGVS